MQKTMKYYGEKIKEDLNIWRAITYSWIERLNILKMSGLQAQHISLVPFQSQF